MREADLLRASRDLARNEIDLRDSKEGQIVGQEADYYLVKRTGTSRPVPAKYAGVAAVGQYCELKFIHPNRYIIIAVYDRPGTFASPPAITPQGFALAPPDNFRALPGMPDAVLFAWDTPPEQVVSFEVFTASGVDVTGLTGVDTYMVTRGSVCIVDSEIPLYARVRSIALNGNERSAFSEWILASLGTSGTGTIEVSDDTTTVSATTAVEFTSGATVTDAGGGLAQVAIAGGAGDITGPASSTDHALARWNGVDGDALQDSTVIVDDSGNIDFGGGTGHNLRDKIIAANSGTSYAIDMETAGVYEITLNDDPTLTVTNVEAGRAVTIKLIQDGTGGRVVTWGTTIEWFQGSEPTLQTGIGAIDIVVLTVRNDGTTIDGLAADVIPADAVSKTRTITRKLYDSTLTSNGIFDVQETDLISGSGAFADYDRLELVLEARSTVSAVNDTLVMVYNNDTTLSNYDGALHYAGIGHASVRRDFPDIGYAVAATGPADFRATFRITIPSPGGAQKKTADIINVFTDGAASHYISQLSTFWQNTAAITRISIRPDGYATDTLVGNTGGTAARLIIYGVKEEEIGGGGENLRQAVFFFGSTVSTGQHPMRIYNQYGSDRQIERVDLFARTGPVGDDLIVDVNLGGTTIFTTQANRPVIADAAQSGSSVLIDVDTWVDGQYLEVDVDQVGTTTSGEDLTVSVVFGGAA